MAGIKHRQRMVSGAGLKFGTLTINAPSAVGYTTVVSASVAVAGIAAGDEIFAQLAGGAGSGMHLTGFAGVAGGVSASWYNSASTNQSASTNVTVYYLALPG